MRLFFAFLFSCFVAGLPVASGSAVADFDEGLLAYLEADYERATAHWLPLAEAGDADAQFAIGMLHEAGQGSSVDLTSAAKWYRRAAEEGHADAQLSLGSLYATGAGVTRDHTEAVEQHGTFGTPTFVFEVGGAAYLKTFIPPEAESVAFFENFAGMTASRAYFGELKRPQPPWPKGAI